jgi:hypothetical protein
MAALAALCRRRRIRRLSLFGSVLKAVARPDSGVDLLVEFEPEAKPGMLGMVPRKSSMQPDDAVRIRHMIEAARTVARFVDGRRRAHLTGMRGVPCWMRARRPAGIVWALRVT